MVMLLGIALANIRFDCLVGWVCNRAESLCNLHGSLQSAA